MPYILSRLTVRYAGEAMDLDTVKLVAAEIDAQAQEPMKYAALLAVAGLSAPQGKLLVAELRALG